MKKAYPANIDGQIFYIDDDAFQLLNSYLDQLRATFRGEEGEEIVNDIESRIRELFAARTSAGANVIVLADVNKVIATMGRPEDLSQEDKSEKFQIISVPGRTPSGMTHPTTARIGAARRLSSPISSLKCRIRFLTQQRLAQAPEKLSTRSPSNITATTRYALKATVNLRLPPA